jgi:hypothetical protein
LDLQDNGHEKAAAEDDRRYLQKGEQRLRKKGQSIVYCDNHQQQLAPVPELEKCIETTYNCFRVLVHPQVSGHVERDERLEMQKEEVRVRDDISR